MSINQQATYLQGQDIVIDVTLTAHHKGHFEFAVCAIAEGEIPTKGERERYWQFLTMMVTFKTHSTIQIHSCEIKLYTQNALNRTN